MSRSVNAELELELGKYAVIFKIADEKDRKAPTKDKVIRSWRLKLFTLLTRTPTYLIRMIRRRMLLVKRRMKKKKKKRITKSR